MKQILGIILFIFSTSLQAAAGIASAHPLATQAGEKILAQGGNAFDAAVAISAALAVVEPYSSGIGGGGFWLLHRSRDDFETMIDGREKAPLQAHRDMYLDKQGDVIAKASMDGPLSAGIPGVPAALAHLSKKYGKLSLKQSLQPAIEYAQQGFKVTPHYQTLAKFRLAALNASPAAAKIFLQKGEVPELGYLIKQADLAKTLQAMAEKGADGFYKGTVAQKMIQGVKEAGGIWRQKDLMQYSVIERKPIIGEFHGMKVTSAAPPSSGGIAILEILNQLSYYPLDNMNNTQAIHLTIEAMRRAYRDRAQFLGDTDFVSVPIKRLISQDYAAGLVAGTHPDKAMPSDLLPGVVHENNSQDTTHFSVIDHEGNRVSATLSINYPFGSCFVAPGTGVLLNDEMDDFSAKPGVANAYGLVGAEANAIQPGKRMLSSMSPTFLETDDRLAVIGTPGGSRIITMVLLGSLGFYLGENASQIVNAPRFHHQYLPDNVAFEPDAFNQKIQHALNNKNHKLKESNGTWGNMQLVIWDKKNKKMTAASDGRGEGLAKVILAE
ncbi:Gamma-glutamyltranspeptidase @ Glutathione hydrolase [hydrothermal vent metagenome]|uniref:Gamma-glutamyltranspeptidase @ Glutathione hydrolase n=1 Tax=hydrothermal vent metagenome TaxID=652676 RepID=A0A3B0WXG9_9ZZZZ